MLEWSSFSVKEWFLSWVSAGPSKHRNLGWLWSQKDGQWTWPLTFHSLGRVKGEIGLFLPFEVTCDITLRLFPPPLFFFFLKTLFLLMCFSARKNDIRKNTLYRLQRGQEWKSRSEIFFVKKILTSLWWLKHHLILENFDIYLILLPTTF